MAAHWFIVRFPDDLFRVEWFEAEFNRANGRLDCLSPLHGARDEAEAVAVVRAKYRQLRAEAEARLREIEKEYEP